MSERLESIHYLKNSLNSMGEEDLRRTLTYLLKVYVLDGNSSNASSTSRLPKGKDSSFFDIMSSLKSEYTAPELDRFELESGKVFIEVNNRRVELTMDNSPMPMQGEAITPTLQPEPVMSPPSDNTPVADDSEKSPQRFRNLEF